MIHLPTWFDKRVLESPEWKTFFSAVLPILIGVLSGIFVAQISTSSGIDWGSCYTAGSFYLLVATTIITYLYHLAVYIHEKQIMRYLDNDYCIAYMRSQCLPEAVEQYKLAIREGHGGELKTAMAELKKALK